MANPSMVVRIAANLAELRANLKEGRDQIEATTAGMQKLSTSFQGDRLIQAAHNVAAAVHNIGGASKLTEAEQAKVNRTVEKALEKYKALGVEAPTALKNLASQTKQTEEKTSLLTRGVQLMIGAFSVAAVKNAVNSVLEFTGSLTDLSGKTGIGVESLQRLAFVTDQSGVSLTRIADGAIMLGRNLVGGNDSAVKGVEALGFNVNDLIQMGPEKAFLGIGEAIAKVPNPMERAALATAIFGRAGAEYLPAFTADMTAVADEAERSGAVLSEDLVKAGDDAGDAVSRFTAVGMSVLAQFLIPVLPALEAAADWLGKALPTALSAARSGVDFLLRKGLELQVWLYETAEAVARTVADVPVLGRVFGSSSADIGVMAEKAQLARDTLSAFNTQGVAPAKVVLEQAIPMVTGFAAAMDDSAGKSDKAGKAAKKAADDAAKAALKLEADYRQVWNEIGVRQMEDAQRAMEAAEQKATADRKYFNAKFEAEIAAVARAQESADAQAKAWREYYNEIGVRRMQDEAAAMEAASKWRENLDGLVGALSQLAQVSGDTFGGIMRDLAGVLTSFNTTTKSTDVMQQGWGQLTGESRNLTAGLINIAQGAIAAGAGFLQATGAGSTFSRTLGGVMSGAQIGSMFGPVGTAIGAVAGGIVGLVRGLTGVSAEVKKARAEVGKFEDALIGTLNATQLAEAGGQRWAQVTIAVRDAYMATGRTSDEAHAAVERLWESSRSGPEASAAAIAEVNAVLEENQRLNDELAESNFTWQDLQKQAEEYGVDLAALGPQFASAKLNEQASNLITFLERARTSGADWGAVMMGTRDEIGKMIGEAKRMGVALPENMRPYINDLLASGNLLDEQGNKMEDISGLTFTEPLEIKVGNLVDEIRELIREMARIPTRVDTQVHTNYTESGNREGGDGDDGYATGTMGRHGSFWRNFGAGMDTRLHGTEAVVTPAQAPAFASEILGGSDPELKAMLRQLPRQIGQQMRWAIQAEGGL